MAVILGLVFVASLRKEWPMTFIAVRCPYCQSNQIGFVNLLRQKLSWNTRIVYPVPAYPLSSPLRTRDFGPALESFPHLLPVVRRR
jgi:hypothetical protein